MTAVTQTPLPDSVQKVAARLAEAGHPHQVVMLPVTGRTAQDAADALGVELGQIAKSIVFRRPANDAAVLVVTAGDHRVNEKKVAAITGPLARADAEFVKAATGFSIGVSGGGRNESQRSNVSGPASPSNARTAKRTWAISS